VLQHAARTALELCLLLRELCHVRCMLLLGLLQLLLQSIHSALRHSKHSCRGVGTLHALAAQAPPPRVPRLAQPTCSSDLSSCRRASCADLSCSAASRSCCSSCIAQ
jgi:hypothetical protein